MDLRERIVAAFEQDGLSIRKIAQRFAVSKNSVERLIKQKRTQGHLIPGKQESTMGSPVIEVVETFESIAPSLKARKMVHHNGD